MNEFTEPDETTVSSRRAAMQGFTPPGSLVVGYLLMVKYVDPDSDVAYASHVDGFDSIERMGACRALTLDMENGWALARCPWEDE